jgi:hypothetical protein
VDASDEAGHAMPDDRRERRRRRALTLAVGLVLIAAGLVATLSHAAKRRTGTNGMPAKVLLGTTPGAGTICQAGERIPADTAAVRVALVGDARIAPRVAVALTRADAVLATGAAGARWERTGALRSAVVVPLGQPLRGAAFGSICFRLRGGAALQYGLLGVQTVPGEGATEDGRELPGRLHLEYLAAGERSWWSLAPTLARRLGRGHAWSGPSVGVLLLLLALTSIGLCAWQLSRTDS